MIPEMAKEPNLSTDRVAVWCGMDACFSICDEGDNFGPEDEDGEKHLCENYTQGIVVWFETEPNEA